jgi:hypothetical protein
LVYLVAEIHGCSQCLRLTFFCLISLKDACFVCLCRYICIPGQFVLSSFSLVMEAVLKGHDTLDRLDYPATTWTVLLPHPETGTSWAHRAVSTPHMACQVKGTHMGSWHCSLRKSSWCTLKNRAIQDFGGALTCGVRHEIQERSDGTVHILIAKPFRYQVLRCSCVRIDPIILYSGISLPVPVTFNFNSSSV